RTTLTRQLVREKSFCIANNMFLLGEPLSSLTPGARAVKGKKIPSIKDCLRYVQYLLKEEKNTSTSEHLTTAITEARQIWLDIGFPDENLREKHKIKQMLESYHARYLVLCKSQHKTSETQRDIERKFSNEINVIFDISKKTKENTLPVTLGKILTEARKNHTTLFNVISEAPINNSTSTRKDKKLHTTQHSVPCSSS
ncbi:Glycine--tRNA ligase, partial [Frankliniella fusca]